MRMLWMESFSVSPCPPRPLRPFWPVAHFALTLYSTAAYGDVDEADADDPLDQTDAPVRFDGVFKIPPIIRRNRIPSNPRHLPNSKLELESSDPAASSLPSTPFPSLYGRMIKERSAHFSTAKKASLFPGVDFLARDF